MLFSSMQIDAHRDQDSSSNSISGSSLRLDGSEDASSIIARSSSAVEALVQTMEHDCKTEEELYKNTESGIAALRSCVKALEEYATQVNEHEKESYASHDKYRRSFIQTYALLKSLINDKEELHRFHVTFNRDHIKAANALKKKLDAINAAAGAIRGAASSLLETIPSGHVRNVSK
eukprot:CAMPEP_0169102682 /NCGR_PEP_ID=MMETSP1015-20121227/22301_1 /TAXON_ID=342587 /ORGANISM="Karlodinium micrum, Strain CCMP2283" /LENGTH=175 /DNA_ID=CAMNT_0009163807 /DNA_START=144 /DNA_END=671 /DNA_ORIENTATION=-